MGAYSYSGTAASNTTVDGIGAAGSDSPDNIDNLVRALAASDANLVRDLGGANTVAGTADAIAVALADASTPAYFDGMRFSFRAASDTTVTGPTLNVDSLGAKTIKKTIQGVESALVVGDIQAGQTVEVVYRSAWAAAAGAFELLNPTFAIADALTMTAALQSQARTNISAALKGQIFGLTLSNNGSDATNDIDIAAGEAASTETNPVLMVLASALTKRLDAAWAVGTNQGGLDTGSIANNTYHIWLIQRSDTGVVDALFSLSASSPTMPSGYDRKRRIGSIMRAAGAIRAFTQIGDFFYLSTPVNDYTGTAAVSDVLPTLTVPSGLVLEPLISGNIQASGGGGICQLGIRGASWPNEIIYGPTSQSGITMHNAWFGGIFTNTSGQVRLSIVIFAGTVLATNLFTSGWIDYRGKDA
jgi:hypothetical protein